MHHDELKATVLRVLASIAPEAAFAALRPDLPFREQLDVDSRHLLNATIALADALKVEIPQADMPRLATLDGAVSYLETALAVGA